MTKRKPKSEHKKPGPKPQLFDIELIERIASRMASQREIAACLGVSEGLLRQRIESDPAVAEAIERGKALGCATIRTRQIDLAMAGNPTMLIWVGKQYLEQRDQTKTEHAGKVQHQLGSFADLFDLANKEDDDEPSSASRAEAPIASMPNES